MTVETSRGTMVLMTRLSRQIYRQAIEGGLGMHPKQYAVLSVVRDHPKITQQEVGSVLCVDANTVVHLLDAVEEQGWAQRQRDPEDRRRHVIALTPKGEKAIIGVEESLNAIEDEVLADLSKPERDKLWDLLRRAVD